MKLSFQQICFLRDTLNKAEYENLKKSYSPGFIAYMLENFNNIRIFEAGLKDYVNRFFINYNKIKELYPLISIKDMLLYGDIAVFEGRKKTVYSGEKYSNRKYTNINFETLENQNLIGKDKEGNYYPFKNDLYHEFLQLYIDYNIIQRVYGELFKKHLEELQ